MLKTIKSFFNWLFKDIPRWPTAKDVEEAEAHIARVANEELAVACRIQNAAANKPLSDGAATLLVSETKPKRTYKRKKPTKSKPKKRK